jgi:hypothetical protein
MFDTFAHGVSRRNPRELTSRRGRSSRAVPTLDRHFLHAAHRDPHLAGRDAGGQSLLRRAVAQLDDDGVAQQNASEVAELVGDGAGELAELQKLRPLN